MRVLVTTVQVPFIKGGAEILANGLVKALVEAGHEAEIATMPFKWYPPECLLEHMLACRLLDLTESCGQKIDRVIGLKFPAYLVQHPNKVMWLLHQHRTAYDLWEGAYSDLIHFPNGIQVRNAIVNADNKAFNECGSIYTISGNVSKRLQQFNQVASIPLYHPPQSADQFHCQEAEDYLFFPSRLTTIKRQELVLQALVETRKPVKVIFAGEADHNVYFDHLLNVVDKLQIQDRVVFLGRISEEQKIQLYAQSLGVVYPPFDEDYGYVTLEAMLSAKAVVTCLDSGGSLEFVKDQETGLVVEPTPQAMAEALDLLWQNRSWAQELGQAGRKRYQDLEITWSNVVKSLLT